MTKQEKIIVSAYTGVLMCEFADLQKYIEKKFGRPVFTHELADKGMLAEIKEKTKEEFLEICNREEPQWIPCSERLPEDLEEVNVTWVNHTPEPYYDFLKDKPFAGSAVYYRGEWFWYSSTCVDILAEYGTNNMDKVDDGIEITAWMPLPEPYGGESE